MYTKNDYFEMITSLRTLPLIEWYKANKPEWNGPLVFPATWRGRSVRKMFNENCTMPPSGNIYFEGYPVAIQGEQTPVVSRREIRPLSHRSSIA